MTEQRDLHVNDAHREVDGIAQRSSENPVDRGELLQALNAFIRVFNTQVVVQDRRDLEMGTLGSPGGEIFILFNFKLTI